MEFQHTNDQYSGLNLAEKVRLYNENGVTLEHCKWWFDFKRPQMQAVTLKFFRQQCSKLEGATPLEPSPKIKGILQATFNFTGAAAINIVADSKTAVTTENVISISLMASQMNKFQVDFAGGSTPTYTFYGAEITQPDPKIQASYPFLGELKVMGGVPFYTTQTCEVFKQIGVKSMDAVNPMVANFSSIVASTFNFNVAKDAVPRQFIPSKISLPNVDRQMLTSGLADFVMKSFKHNPCGAYVAAADICKMSAKLVPVIKAKKPMGVDKKITSQSPVIGGRTFAELSIDVLKKFWREGYSQLAKAKDLIKNSDTGFSSINCPLKWKMPLEFVTGDPDNVEFEPTLRISYWGAGGNRARRLFNRRGIVSAYDLKASPVVTKKITQDDFIKYKIFPWVVKDIFQQTNFAGADVFVSDIFIDNWAIDQSPDPNGHRFVSGILRGQIVNGENVSCKRMPPIRLVKGFLPTIEEMRLYDGAYPFWGFRVCRPLTTEVIYLKPHDNAVLDTISENFELMVANYGEEFRNRCQLIGDHTEFSMWVKKCWVGVCSELNFQQRRLILDPRDMVASPLNRKWGLTANDLPCLFVPKHMRGGAINALDVNSSFFGAVVLNQVWDDEDAEDLVAAYQATGEDGEFGDGNDQGGDENEFAAVDVNDELFNLDEDAYG